MHAAAHGRTLKCVDAIALPLQFACTEKLEPNGALAQWRNERVASVSIGTKVNDFSLSLQPCRSRGLAHDIVANSPQWRPLNDVVAR